MFVKIVLFSIIPIITIWLGAIIAGFYPPKRKVRSVILHFAGGVVFSVVAVELLPDIIKNTSIPNLSIGFGLGVALMLALKYYTHKLEKAKQNTKELQGVYPMGMLAGIGIDIFIDGLLIGVGFSAGQKEGVLLTVALAVEIFALGLAVSSELSQSKIKTRGKLIVFLILGLLIISGAAIGAIVLQNAGESFMELILSFGLAALLYLVTEELLVEAHEEPDTPLISLSFFVGFFVFLIFGLIQ